MPAVALRTPPRPATHPGTRALCVWAPASRLTRRRPECECGRPQLASTGRALASILTLEGGRCGGPPRPSTRARRVRGACDLAPPPVPAAVGQRASPATLVHAGIRDARILPSPDAAHAISPRRPAPSNACGTAATNARRRVRRRRSSIVSSGVPNRQQPVAPSGLAVGAVKTAEGVARPLLTTADVYERRAGLAARCGKGAPYPAYMDDGAHAAPRTLRIDLPAVLGLTICPRRQACRRAAPLCSSSVCGGGGASN